MPTDEDDSVKLTLGKSNEGIQLTFGTHAARRLERDLTTDQLSPRRTYVYAHINEAQVIFYIGMGAGRRAWHDDRNHLWHRYVETHLHGKYSVVILQDDLTPEQAERVESAWIAQESETLVNLQNLSYSLDLDAAAHRDKLRLENLGLIAAAKAEEYVNLESAVSMYRRALAQLANYAHIQSDRGLIGQLIGEEALDLGVRGEFQIIDRLTLCLVRLGRRDEAHSVASEYFTKYRADLTLKSALSVQRRVSKGSGRKGE